MKASWIISVVLMLLSLQFSQSLSANGGPVGVDGECYGLDVDKQEIHAAAGGFCYRFELSCKGDVNGGFGGALHPNGFVEGGMGGTIGPPPPLPPLNQPECGMGFGHFLNAKIEHTCTFAGFGKVELEIKAVNLAALFLCN